MATTTIIISALVLLVGALLAVILWLWPQRPRKKPTVKYQSWEYPIIGQDKKVEQNVPVKSKPLIERLVPYAKVIGGIGTLGSLIMNVWLLLSPPGCNTHSIQVIEPLPADPKIELFEHEPEASTDSTNLACIDPYVQKSTTYE